MRTPFLLCTALTLAACAVTAVDETERASEAIVKSGNPDPDPVPTCPVGKDWVPGKGCVSVVADPPPPPNTPANIATLRYNQVAQLSSHNSYETEGDGFNRKESLFDQLAYHHVRSLELDIHRDLHYTPSLTNPGIGSDFWVYHTYYDYRDPSCERLSTCLAEVRGFHAQNPAHEALTIWLEPKDGNWNDSRSPAALDADLMAGVGAEAIFTPRMMLDQCNAQRARVGQPGVSTLQDSLATCGWPTLLSLRGKILFVVMQTTLGSDGSTQATVRDYSQNRAGDFNEGRTLDRTAFIAPDGAGLLDHNAVFSNFNQPTASAQSWIRANVHMGSADPTTLIVSRAMTDDAPTFGGNRALGVHHLGTEHVNADTDASYATHNAHGWPFSAIPSAHLDVAAFGDDETSMRLAGASGDLEGTSDNFLFDYLYNHDVSASWSGFITSAGDSGNEWAKGCFMARQDLSVDSPYFAVCRPNGAHNMRIQYRLHRGDGTSRPEFDGYGTLAGGAAAGFTLAENADGKWCASANATLGNTTAIQFSDCFDAPLPYQGIAVSAHGDTNKKFVFGKVSRIDSANASHAVTAAQLFLGRVGTNTTITSYGDGWL